MKKASKYDKMFDAMREVLIEYATAKDAEGRWLHKTPEIMRKFGFGNDPKVIDGFNRWLNRQGIYRCPKPRRSERLHIEAEIVDTLTPTIKTLEEATAELFPPETEKVPEGWHYSQTQMDRARHLIENAYSRIVEAAKLLVDVDSVLDFKAVRLVSVVKDSINE